MPLAAAVDHARGRILNAQEKCDIRRMLENNVPINKICETLSLEDADLIYEVTYGNRIRNRTAMATAKWTEACRHRTRPNPYDLAKEHIGAKRDSRGSLTILELGCGTGWLAASLARRFPDSMIDGIELTAAGVAQAKKCYADLSNLRVWQGDGYELWKTTEKRYDVVLHIDVLEHVPRREAYIAAGLRLLKEDGLMIISFPTEAYWRFWGWPKLALSRLLGRPFTTHSCSHQLIERYLCERDLSFSCRFTTFCPPRRLFYYIPRRWLAVAGRLCSWMEERLSNIGFVGPLLSAVYGIRRGRVNSPQILEQTRAQRKKNGVMLLVENVAAVLVLGVLWVASNILMGWEIMRGRKSVFHQE